MKKTRTIFVGSFLEESKTGSVGGQMFACRSIINSELSDTIEWLKIDSTADTNLKRSLFKRGFGAFKRIFKLLRLLSTKRNVRQVLIFTSNGFSFTEKGLMLLLSSVIFRKKTILAPRSGRIINDLKKQKKKRFIQLVFAKATLIICQGESWKKLFIKTFPSHNSKKYVVIKNWIDTENSLPLLKIQAVKNQILYLGWLEKDKGIYDLLVAAKRLKEEKVKFQLIIGGEGKEKENFLKEIKRNNLQNQVQLLGWIKGEKKKEILASSEIFVLPSYFEGMPNALLEAMSMGKACVATNVGGIPDLVTHNKNGLLVEAGDTEALYKHLKGLLLDDELKQKLAFEARETVEQYHTIKNTIPQLKKIFFDETNYSRP